jgi:hypothetical protein
MRSRLGFRLFLQATRLPVLNVSITCYCLMHSKSTALQSLWQSLTVNMSIKPLEKLIAFLYNCVGFSWTWVRITDARLFCLSDGLRRCVPFTFFRGCHFGCWLHAVWIRAFVYVAHSLAFYLEQVAGSEADWVQIRERWLEIRQGERRRSEMGW